MNLSQKGSYVCNSQMNRVSFTVPLVPPSVNHYVRHFRSDGHKVTDEATAFKLGSLLRGQSLLRPCQAIQRTLYIVLGKGDRGDRDNFPKLCLDGLADAGVFRDPRGKPSPRRACAASGCGGGQRFAAR